MTLQAERYRVIHETSYDYDSPVSLSRQQLHLTPRDCPWQSSIAHRITIDPVPAFTQSRQDPFANPVKLFAIEAPHNRLVVRADSMVEVRPRPFAGRLEESLPPARLTGIFRFRPFLLYAESPLVRCGQGADAIHLRRIRLRPQSHNGFHACPQDIGRKKGGLPGFRTPDAGVPAFARIGRTLRQRLSTHKAATREAPNGWR